MSALGASVAGDTVTFSVWAPRRRAVDVVLDGRPPQTLGAVASVQLTTGAGPESGGPASPGPASPGEPVSGEPSAQTCSHADEVLDVGWFPEADLPASDEAPRDPPGGPPDGGQRPGNTGQVPDPFCRKSSRPMEKRQP